MAIVDNRRPPCNRQLLCSLARDPDLRDFKDQGLHDTAAVLIRFDKGAMIAGAVSLWPGLAFVP
jgi:hypothetical protein